MRQFNDLVSEVQKLSYEEKEELRFILGKYLVEERRTEIAENMQSSLKEYHEGLLNFSGDINELKREVQ
ncbi:MAG: hypothetical protein OEZ36_03835 [Spirochaetota bacterium]|nr:hypothetical protein [Spirochaetota bacterium]